MDEQNYPKLQWSIFVKNGKDQQYVVRAETPEELAELKKFVLSEIGGQYIETQETIKPIVQPNATCVTCGEPALERRGTAKNGKSYHAIFCSTENRNHTQWL